MKESESASVSESFIPHSALKPTPRLPFHDPGTRPMAEGGYIQLGHGNIPPDFEHVPQADVIQQDQHSIPEGDPLEIFQEFLLRDPVFRSVEENEIGGLEDIPVLQKNVGPTQVVEELET
jgi:hypothetical protein